ncbi:MAG: formate dehydrogenase accessory protein FdhE [Proteobacteria bacterium]|nr:formate dehydrogenase accessory protein FdhE [Burkholderiales bacterium]
MSLQRLAALDTQNPEWRPWIAMVRVLGPSIDDPVWVRPVSTRLNAHTDRPLLDGAQLHVPQRAASTLVRTLLDLAPRAERVAPSARERWIETRLLPLLQKSIAADHEVDENHDGNEGDEGEEMDRHSGVTPGALLTVVNAVALPVLTAAAAQCAPQLPTHWPHCGCPVCGAPPALTELIGLDRSRRLRCARCGTGWATSTLRCAFCGQTDHEQLGALVAETALDGPRVETCARCRGYLKTVAVLSQGSHLDVLIADLESVTLDLAAHAAGFVRPGGTGRALACTVAWSPSGVAR